MFDFSIVCALERNFGYVFTFFNSIASVNLVIELPPALAQ